MSKVIRFLDACMVYNVEHRIDRVNLCKRLSFRPERDKSIGRD